MLYRSFIEPGAIGRLPIARVPHRLREPGREKPPVERPRIYPRREVEDRWALP